MTKVSIALPRYAVADLVRMRAIVFTHLFLREIHEQVAAEQGNCTVLARKILEKLQS